MSFERLTADELPSALNWEARDILNGVERWAAGCWMLRELELIGDEAKPDAPVWDAARRHHRACSLGRLDALLIPTRFEFVPWHSKIGGWCWAAYRLVGVEVKVDKADFKRGLNEGQFDRYLEGVSALYVATPPGLVKTADIPKHLGHLVVRDKIAVCKRRPTFNDVQPSAAMMWKMFHHLQRECDRQSQALDKRAREGRESAGRKAAKIISKMME